MGAGAMRITWGSLLSHCNQIRAIRETKIIPLFCDDAKATVVQATVKHTEMCYQYSRACWNVLPVQQSMLKCTAGTAEHTKMYCQYSQCWNVLPVPHSVSASKVSKLSLLFHFQRGPSRAGWNKMSVQVNYTNLHWMLGVTPLTDHHDWNKGAFPCPVM